MLSKTRLVPVLVDQFNDIIEWKAQILQSELEFQAQKASCDSTTRRYSNPDLVGPFGLLDLESQLQKSCTESTIPRDEVHPEKEEEIEVEPPSSPSLASQGVKLKRSKSQKTFSRKLDRLRRNIERNTINEEIDQLKPRVDLNNNPVTTKNCKNESEEKVEKVNFELLPVENRSKSPSPIKLETKPAELESTKPSGESELKIKDNLTTVEAKPLPVHNIILEKLMTLFRHNFVVKTVVVSGTGSSGQIAKCPCGQPFSFSDKHLQCITCLTRCHTGCGATIPRPCVRYVDPFLKPSKLITNFVYPRSRPSIPWLLLACCREIEAKCSTGQANRLSQPGQMTLTSFKLYYVESEQLQPVREQCKKLLREAKHGHQSLDHLSLDYLTGMIKYFLADMCEPLFPHANWKDYSINIHKRTDSELKHSLLETFDQLPAPNVQTLCFMLLHLKHLVECGWQDQGILADIFCPILLGDIEVRRKLRLIKTMFQLEHNVLLSYVVS